MSGLSGPSLLLASSTLWPWVRGLQGTWESTSIGLRLSSIALTALLTSAAVAYAGVITFVGLIVPHVLRLLIGPANKWLIPSALLGGCLLVTLSDIAARTVVPYADLPIGIFTAIVGGPTFFILLRRGMGGEKALG